MANKEKVNIYKRVFKKFLNSLVKDFKVLFDKDITLESIDIDKDYGVYNSFKIKEAPQFLFGAWITTDTLIESHYNFENDTTTEETVRYYRIDFFGDFEEEIDKFKPWRCHFNKTLHVKEDFLNKLEDLNISEVCGNFTSVYDIARVINFIIEEPELAFNTCWNGIDYNEQYVSREDAHKEYLDYLKYKKDLKEQNNLALKEKIEYLRDLLESKGLKQFKDYVFTDINKSGGFKTSPHIEITIRISKTIANNSELSSNDNGYYGLYDICDILTNTEDDSIELYRKISEFEEHLNDKYKYYSYWGEVSTSCYCCTSKRFSRLKKNKCIIDVYDDSTYLDK